MKNYCTKTTCPIFKWQLLRKTLLIMKFSSFLLLIATLHSYASGYSQEAKFNFSVQNKTMLEVLRMIEKQSDYRFFFSDNYQELSNTISFEAKNEDLSRVLKNLLSDKAISYKVLENNIIVIAPVKVLQQQKITGTVTDATTGEPITGANIIIEGTAIGVVTDANGKFSLDITKPDAVLVISFLGYIPEHVSLNGQTALDIKLVTDITNLDEIVVVGYGSVRKKDLTSAITNVGSEKFNQGAANSVAELITGKVAGLSISSTVADPSSAASLQIRGIGSMNASNEPLVIIDGVPGASLNSVSQQDIESFSILKDGAAASIYGTRGANGVILITTKLGSKNDKVNVGYDTYISTQQIIKYPDVMNRDEFAKNRTTYPDYGGNTNWLKEISRPSFDQNQNLSLSYGTENNSYRASVTYRKTLAITDEVDRKEYGGRINFKNKFFDKRFELSGSISIRNSFSNSLPDEDLNNGLNVWNQAAVMNPTMPVYNEDGSFYLPPTAFNDNPVGMLKNNTNYTETKYNNYDLTLKWNILKSLNSSVMYAQQILDNDISQYANGETKLNHDSGIDGVAVREYNKNTIRLFEWNTNYEISLGVHNLKLLGGYSYQDVTDNSFYASNSDFPSESLTYNDLESGSYNALGLATMDSNKEQSKLVAFYGRAIYSYKDMLLATATIRQEGSTKYGTNNKWGTFKSLSAAWRISQMGFMKEMVSGGIVDDLKLRAGYGETGRDITSPYQSQATYGGTSKYYMEGEWTTAQGPTINANADLRWERAIHYGIGLDFTLLNRQLTGSVDWFIRDSKDLLYEYPAIQPPMIESTIMVNVGTIRSKGFEWDVNWSNKPNSKLKYSVGLLGSYTMTNVVSLSNDLYSATYTELYNLPYTSGNAIRMEEGHEVGLFYGYRYAGVDADGNFLIYNKAGEAIPGDQKSEEDKSYIGHGVPRWQLTLSHSLVYKNFDLSLQFKSCLDFNILNARDMYWGLQSSAEQNLLKTAYEKNKNITGDLVYSDYFIEKGDYLKLDLATIGYNLPISKGKAISSVHVYFSANNLFTITGYSGSDPANVNVNGLTPSIEDVNGYPVVRTFTLGAKLNF
jgi:TonB-dependent starch-binding outer membrane protein SusC